MYQSLKSEQGVNNLETSWFLTPEFGCRLLTLYKLQQTYLSAEYFGTQGLHLRRAEIGRNKLALPRMSCICVITARCWHKQGLPLPAQSAEPQAFWLAAEFCPGSSQSGQKKPGFICKMQRLGKLFPTKSTHYLPAHKGTPIKSFKLQSLQISYFKPIRARIICVLKLAEVYLVGSFQLGVLYDSTYCSKTWFQ